MKVIFGALILCVLWTFVESFWSDICRGWHHTIECGDSAEIEIQNVAFLPVGDKCKAMEFATLSYQTPTIQTQSNCSSNTLLNLAVSRCKGLSMCLLSEDLLISKSCEWPDETMLRITFDCHKVYTCPREILGISTQRYSRNLHRRPAAWCRDPSEHSNAIYLMPWTRHGETKAVYKFSTLKSFVLGRPSSVYNLPTAASSTSLVAYDGFLYYIKDQTRDLTKYSLLNRRKIAEKPIKNALYSHATEYSNFIGYSDIDLAVDELGLWVIYSTDESKGRIVLSHINVDDLSIMRTWITDIPKRDVLNAFMVCGNLHAISNKTRRMHRKYYTSSNQSSNVPANINITIPSQQTTAVNYNPRDNTLYVWSTSQAVIFTLDVGYNTHVTMNTVSSQEYSVQYTASIQHNWSYERPALKITNSQDATTYALPESSLVTNVTSQPICAQTIFYDMVWPGTNAGKTMLMDCPSGARGSASWKCIYEKEKNIHWDTHGPNLSNCAEWTIDIDRTLQQKNSSSIAHEIAEKLSNIVAELKENEHGMKASDLHFTAEIMGEITNIAKLSSDIEGTGNLSEEERSEKLVQLNKALLRSGSDLVDEEMTSAWHNLIGNEKREIGNAIMDSVEESAFLLADQDENKLINSEKTGVDRVIEEENILIGIQVQRSNHNGNGINDTNTVKFPNSILLDENSAWQNTTDSIQISNRDVVHNQQYGNTKIVFALYNRLAELVDDGKDSVMDNDKLQVNSKIISASIQSVHQRIKLKEPAVITLEHIKPSNESHVCVYWNSQSSNTSQKWLSDGCTLISSNTSHTVCSCDHLTSFAILINHRGFILDRDADILDMLTWIGLSMSLVCLAFSILTFIYFKSLHCTRTTVHTNLCICLFLSQLIFLAGVDLTNYAIACSVIAGLLHYFLLASFVWIALEGFQLYVMIIEVFERNTNIAWYYLVGYGVPAIFVALSAGLNPSGYGTETACWLKTELHGTMGTIGGVTPFIWAFVGPASLIALGNIVFLILTAVTMYRHGRKYIYYSKMQAIRSALRGTFALVCLLGTTWVIGLLWWWEGMLFLQYLFCILNAFQGVYIFIFHCLMHNKVRYEYRKFLSRCLGESYADLLNSTSFTVKHSGIRRRSTQIYYSQKRKNSGSLKGSLRPSYYDEKPGATGTTGSKNFNEASKFFTAQDRASMQILLTRRESLINNFQPTKNQSSNTEYHQRSLSTRSCTSKYSPNKRKHGSYHKEEAAPLKRCNSERRYYRGKYNAPVTEEVSRILKSAGSTHSMATPSRYLPPSKMEINEKFDKPNLIISSLPKDSKIRETSNAPLSPPSGPNAPTKEFKLVDKRLEKFRRMNATDVSPRLGRSVSLNAAEKKRRDMRKLQLVQPATSVPDLMTQLSAKIESRDISQVLLMYLDKDGTLNRQKMEKLRMANETK